MGVGLKGQEKLLACNLNRLQELIGEDSEAYGEEFAAQYKHYESTLQVFLLQPEGQNSQHLIELIGFISRVIHHYPEQGKKFAENLVSLLREQQLNLTSELRQSICKALVSLRNKGIIPGLEVLKTFFDLFRCPDKELRKYLFGSIVAHIKQICTQKRDPTLNSAIKNYMFAKLRDEHMATVRISMMLMMDLYRKSLWNDAKTANVISSCCLMRNSREEGMCENLQEELERDDPETYRRFMRMDQDTFQMILDKIRPLISKQDTQMRESIPAKVRLAVTLRFLATGMVYIH